MIKEHKYQEVDQLLLRKIAIKIVNKTNTVKANATADHNVRKI